MPRAKNVMDALHLWNQNIKLYDFEIILSVQSWSKKIIKNSAGVKVAFPCISRLDEKHVKLLAKKCENVIFLKSSRKEEKNGVLQHWNYKDRCYATQLLARLVCI